MMTSPLNHSDLDERTPELMTVNGTDIGVTPTARAGPVVGPGRSRSLVYSIVAALVLASAGIVFLLVTTVPQADLDEAEAQIAALESEFSAAEQASAEAAREAAASAAALSEQLSDLEADLASTTAELTGTANTLSDSRSDVARLQTEVADASATLTDAEEAISGARSGADAVHSLVGLRLAWQSWNTSSDAFAEIESQSIDVSGIDQAINSLGLGETWQAWAETNFFSAARTMEDFVDDVDDPALTDAWAAWFVCSTMRECTEAGVEFDGALLRALDESMASMRAELGFSEADF